ncbi:MAG: hypothetical protein GXO19_04705 [Epsilonproteobacteria bacterium]|nr:hypothetical protein [Campylobacterota bacterium]NPA57019.1 hypothetical protein [Campylobacterota bacterium]
MREVKEYLLALLIVILGLVAVLKLIDEKRVPIPVRTTEINMTLDLNLTPLPKRVEDEKDRDPLKLFAKTLFPIPEEGYHYLIVEGKSYPIENGVAVVEGEFQGPVHGKLVRRERVCAIPKAAVIQEGERSFVLNSEGKRVEVTPLLQGREYLYVKLPCPRIVLLHSGATPDPQSPQRPPSE